VLLTILTVNLEVFILVLLKRLIDGSAVVVSLQVVGFMLSMKNNNRCDNMLAEGGTGTGTGKGIGIKPG